MLKAVRLPSYLICAPRQSASKPASCTSRIVWLGFESLGNCEFEWPIICYVRNVRSDFRLSPAPSWDQVSWFARRPISFFPTKIGIGTVTERVVHWMLLPSWFNLRGNSWRLWCNLWWLTENGVITDKEIVGPLLESLDPEVVQNKGHQKKFAKTAVSSSRTELYLACWLVW